MWRLFDNAYSGANPRTSQQNSNVTAETSHTQSAAEGAHSRLLFIDSDVLLPVTAAFPASVLFSWFFWSLDSSVAWFPFDNIFIVFPTLYFINFGKGFIYFASLNDSPHIYLSREKVHTGLGIHTEGSENDFCIRFSSSMRVLESNSGCEFGSNCFCPLSHLLALHFIFDLMAFTLFLILCILCQFSDFLSWPLRSSTSVFLLFGITTFDCSFFYVLISYRFCLSCFKRLGLNFKIVFGVSSFLIFMSLPSKYYWVSFL